jgi:myo-inositol-1(or 4)-monophosphatase
VTATAPDPDTLDDVQSVARAAVLAGGAELRRRYRGDDVDASYGPTDVKIAADEAAEARMLPVVRRALPDHAVFTAEAGEFAGEGPYRWVVDPLDETNDFAVGLPTFATSVVVLYEGTRVLSAVHPPVSGEFYLARRGEGVRYDGQRVTADSDRPLEAAPVATIVGRAVPRDPALASRADAIRAELRGAVKRVVSSWAPTVHSGLFARGRLRGLVQFHPDEEERAVTDLLASEAGGVTKRDGPLSVTGGDDEAAAALWNTVERAR